MLIAGTSDGVYRVTGPTVDGAFEYERVLDADEVMRVRRFDGLDGVFAATKDGLYRSRDGRDWTDLGVPRTEVYSVATNPGGDRLYAGTHPAHVYVTTGAQDADPHDENAYEWRELEGFQALPSRDEWYTPRHRNEAHVRELDTHAGAPTRVVAGVEAGGVHVSDDDGATWTERTEGVPDDIHHLLVRDSETYVAATGFGLHRTADGGRSWTRLDDDVRQRYFRESVAHDGVLYTSAAMGSSSDWDGGADAALFAMPDGESLREVPSPRPDEVVLSWTVAGDHLVGGTNAGTLLTRPADAAWDADWSAAGDLPVGGQGVRSLCVAPTGRETRTP